MVINSDTKISQLLKEQPKALEAISRLAKPLQKLRNPLLRKLMASRTTIRQAADIGGCSVEAFFQVLRPLGFKTDDNLRENIKAHTPGPRPGWLTTLPDHQIQTFDVRPMLTGGQDPLKEIMAAYKELSPATALRIVNTFVPTPLLRLLENKGALTYCEQPGDRLTYSYFFKPSGNDVKDTSPQLKADSRKDLITTVTQAQFQEELSRFNPADLQQADVRELEMPGPMQTILRYLEQLPKGHGLLVHHKRIPVYLLEDLQASGDFRVLVLPVSDTEVKLLLTHNDQLKWQK